MYARKAVRSGTDDTEQNTEQSACPYEAHGPEKDTNNQLVQKGGKCYDPGDTWRTGD